MSGYTEIYKILFWCFRNQNINWKATCTPYFPTTGLTE